MVYRLYAGSAAGLFRLLSSRKPCLVCGTEKLSFVYKDAYECQSCSSIQRRPQPNRSIWKIKNDHFELSAASDSEVRRVRELNANQQLERLETFQNVGAVFDVAAAGGFFLIAARERGWEVDGNDISSDAVAYANNQYSIKLHRGYLEEIVISPSKYEAINMWNALEHLHDPMGALKICHEILAPEGILMVKLPDKGPEMIPLLYEDGHLFEWKAEKSTQVIESVGFERVWHNNEKATDGSVSTIESFFRKI